MSVLGLLAISVCVISLLLQVADENGVRRSLSKLELLQRIEDMSRSH